jgi:hypothetical protein
MKERVVACFLTIERKERIEGQLRAECTARRLAKRELKQRQSNAAMPFSVEDEGAV